MRKPRFPDVVPPTEAVSGDADDVDGGPTKVLVPGGKLGTILEEFDKPDEAHPVEFSNDYGETITMVTLEPGRFEVVYPLAKRVPEQVGA